MRPEEMNAAGEKGSKEQIAEDREKRYEKSEPIGTKEGIPGYGQAPEGVRTLRLPDEAPKKSSSIDEQEDEQD